MTNSRNKSDYNRNAPTYGRVRGFRDDLDDRNRRNTNDCLDRIENIQITIDDLLSQLTELSPRQRLVLAGDILGNSKEFGSALGYDIFGDIRDTTVFVPAHICLGNCCTICNDAHKGIRKISPTLENEISACTDETLESFKKVLIACTNELGLKRLVMKYDDEVVVEEAQPEVKRRLDIETINITRPHVTNEQWRDLIRLPAPERTRKLITTVCDTLGVPYGTRDALLRDDGLIKALNESNKEAIKKWAVVNASLIKLNRISDLNSLMLGLYKNAVRFVSEFERETSVNDIASFIDMISDLIPEFVSYTDDYVVKDRIAISGNKKLPEHCAVRYGQLAMGYLIKRKLLNRLEFPNLNDVVAELHEVGVANSAAIPLPSRVDYPEYAEDLVLTNETAEYLKEHCKDDSYGSDGIYITKTLPAMLLQHYGKCRFHLIGSLAQSGKSYSLNLFNKDDHKVTVYATQAEMLMRVDLDQLAKSVEFDTLP